MAYQSFEGQKGDSDSFAKLEKLRLPKDMSGKSFLDIGCNEGFFCLEAVKRGASRVVGVDIDAKVLERARNRAEGKPITYKQSTWWELPKEKFDIILMSSALHYEPRPRELVAEIAKRLAPDGIFILEAGLYAGSAERILVEVQRHDGTLMFPTRRTLVEDVLGNMVVRYIGPSVMQKGDPLERHVFHCSTKLPVAIILSGDSGDGKTYLSTMLSARAGAPRFDHDHVLGIIAKDEFKSRNPLVKEIASRYDVRKIYRLVQELVAEGKGPAYGELLARHVSSEDEVILIEGYGFLFPEILDPFAEALRRRGFVVWASRRLK